MPHARKRYCFDKLKKKIKFAPVVAIQGARQTGKSFLARQFLPSEFPESSYLTFDRESTRSAAQTDAETFLARHSSSQPLIIDEAQKVPSFFDAVKLEVDLERRPSRYVLLGSTQFSTLQGIRESLTGRMSRIRVYPLTLAEISGRDTPVSTSAKENPFYLAKTPKLKRADFLRHLESGGLPGIFAVRSFEEKRQLLQDWIDLTIQRDIHQSKTKGSDTLLAGQVLSQIALLEEPNLGNIAKAVGADYRKVQKQIDLLQDLFVLERVDPCLGSTGKPLYYIFDCGIATLLGASPLRQLETLFLQEYLAKQSFLEQKGIPPMLQFFRSQHGTRVSFVLNLQTTFAAIQIFSTPPRKKTDFFGLEGMKKSLAKNFPTIKQFPLMALSPTIDAPAPKEIKLFQWECLEG